MPFFIYAIVTELGMYYIPSSVTIVVLHDVYNVEVELERIQEQKCILSYLFREISNELHP